MHLIVNLDKPAGITSHEAVRKVRRILGAKKAGHAGTLDPLATGVLLVCLNEATKVSRFLVDRQKSYHARVKLGERTDTYDADGRVIETRRVPSFSPEDIAAVIRTFAGRISQKPPMYSAVKIGGETLYKLARKGIEIERPERVVDIYGIALGRVTLPFFELTVSCSKGTYIRTLCDDIGIKLGPGAHLVSLNRTGVGPFTIADSVTFDELTSQGISSGRGLHSIGEALFGVGEVILNEQDYAKARNGAPISAERAEFSEGELVILKGPSGNLFAMGRVCLGLLRIERILHL